MKLAVSNLALPAFDHARLLPRLAEFGVTGLEIAPFHTWRIESDGVTAQDVRHYGQMAELAGLKIIGMHGLTGRPLEIEKLGIGAYKARIMAQLLDLSVICRDLGGRTLVLEARRRGALSERAAWLALRAFLDEFLPQIENHGTVLCLSPLRGEDGDFCTAARECYMLTNAVDHPAFGLHLGTAALSGVGAPKHTTFAAARGRLELFHIDEPGRALVGATGEVDHVDFRRHLLSSTYDGWVSLVQSSGPADQHAARLAAASTFVHATYFGDLGYKDPRLLENTLYSGRDFQHSRSV